MIVTKDTVIGEILDQDQSVSPIFMEMGMHCLGCPSARSETLEQAAYVHGQDVEQLVAKLNASMNA